MKHRWDISEGPGERADRLQWFEDNACVTCPRFVTPGMEICRGCDRVQIADECYPVVPATWLSPQRTGGNDE